VSSEVNVTSQKFHIKLFVPEADGMTELWLRLESVRSVLNVDCYVFLLIKSSTTTLCLKKVSTGKLSVTLSNLNGLSTFLHC